MLSVGTLPKIHPENVLLKQEHAEAVESSIVHDQFFPYRATRQNQTIKKHSQQQYCNFSVTVRLEFN